MLDVLTLTDSEDIPMILPKIVLKLSVILLENMGLTIFPFFINTALKRLLPVKMPLLMFGRFM